LQTLAHAEGSISVLKDFHTETFAPVASTLMIFRSFVITKTKRCVVLWSQRQGHLQRLLQTDLRNVIRNYVHSPIATAPRMEPGIREISHWRKSPR